MPGVRRINDSEAAMHEYGVGVGVMAAVVGTAMVEMQVCSGFEACVLPSQEPGDAAHQPLPIEVVAGWAEIAASGCG
jgi:hypothetical protein